MAVSPQPPANPEEATREALEQQIQQTRAHLAGTVETLQHRLQDGLQPPMRMEALKTRTRQNPWPMLGAAVGVGFLLSGALMPAVRALVTTLAKSLAMVASTAMGAYLMRRIPAMTPGRRQRPSAQNNRKKKRGFGGSGIKPQLPALSRSSRHGVSLKW